jgi:hypothetical protein
MHHHDRIGRAERQQHDEDDEQHHLDDEHLLAAETVRQVAERGGADQDAEQAGGGDDAPLGRAQREFLGHERQRHAGHEHDDAFEELAGGGQAPDQPLHVGDRGKMHRRGVGPDRRLVDVVLRGFAGRCGRRGVGDHCGR